MNETTKNPMTDIPKFKIGIQIIALVTVLYFLQFVICPALFPMFEMRQEWLFVGDSLVALIGMCILFTKIKRWRFSHVMYAIGIWLLADLLYFLLIFIYNGGLYQIGSGFGGGLGFGRPPKPDPYPHPPDFLGMSFIVCYLAICQILAAFVTVITHFIKKLCIKMKQSG